MSNKNETPELDEKNIPEGGELYIAVKGTTVMLGMKQGGMILQKPVWIKMNIWQWLAMIGSFIGTFSENQIKEITKQFSKDIKVQ